MQPIRPDYDGGCLTSVVRSLSSGGTEPWAPDVVRDARAVVLLVIDGLGWEAVRTHADVMPVTAALDGGPITSVAPSTTAVAMTSLTTGLAPGQHGVTGYRMKINQAILNVLRWSSGPGVDVPDPRTVQPRDAFGGRDLAVVTRKAFAKTPFTELHLSGARMFGWTATSNLVEMTSNLVAEGERFVFAYYDALDVTAHERGLRDGFFLRELRFVDNLVAEILDSVGPDVAVVVTGDHGHVHFDEMVPVTPVAKMVSLYGGDLRFRELHAKSQQADDLLEACRQTFADKAWVMSRDELIDGGWLGPGSVSGTVRRRIGDVILAAREPVAFLDPTNQGESRFRSGHGSFTASEMLVPLVGGRGRA